MWLGLLPPVRRDVDAVVTQPSPELVKFLQGPMRDLRWLFVTLIRIRRKSDNKLVPLAEGRVQRWVHWNYEDMTRLGKPVRLWILKGRQFGISTWVSALLYCMARFRGELCLQLPHKEKPGITMFRKFETMHKWLERNPVGVKGQPVPFSPATNQHDGSLIAFENGGLIKRESAENEDAGVSENYQHVHLTEIPLWKNAEHTMIGLFPTIGDDPGTTIIGEFTARGVGDYSHTTFEEARIGESEFRALFLPWYWHELYELDENETAEELRRRGLTSEEKRYREMVAKDGYEYPLTETGKLKKKFEGTRTDLPDTFQTGFALTVSQLLWRRRQVRKAKGDYDLWNREYPHTPESAFQSSGRRVIPPGVMDTMYLAKRDPLRKGEIHNKMVKGKATPRFIEADDGRLWQWERPQAGCNYLLSCDVSSGVGLDDSAIHVLKLGHRRIELVASFVGKERPHDLARLLGRLARAYRSGMVKKGDRVDYASGRPAMIAPERNGFGEHVIHELTENLGLRSSVYRHELKNSDLVVMGHVYGFPTTRSTKIPMLQMLVQVCFDEYLVVPCQRTLEQMRNLVYLDDDDKAAGAPQGAHDDAAMSVGIGAWVAMQRLSVRKPARNSTNLPDSRYDSQQDVLPTGS